FFNHTLSRWLCNEQKQRALRTVRFDVEALKMKAACAVGAKSCIKMSKIAEGAHNKIYHLEFDNGKEAIARIPCPVIGRSCISQVIASEVATMNFFRSKLKMKVPRVFAWSRTNEDRGSVGTDYIIMEKIDGVPLEQRNHSLTEEHLDVALISDLIDVELLFKTISFSQIGSIYYKEDVETPSLTRAHKPISTSPGIEDDAYSERFRIGPVLDRLFWHGGRDALSANRGPFSDFLSYLIALAQLERAWWKRHGPKYFENHPGPGSTKMALEIFDQIIATAPYLVPKNPEFHEIVFWHTDLHAANIMISSSGPGRITGIIDWQNLSTGIYFTKACLASAMIYRGDLVQSEPLFMPALLPPNYDELSPERQKDAQAQLWLGRRLKRYELQVYNLDPLRLRAILPTQQRLIQSLLGQIPLASQFGGLITLREHVINIWRYWSDIAEESPCPIHFGEDDLERHAEE
ncbi:hypothetical protein SISNIDRAFT_386629, partial [Sistotremastrum niveocremeum HHB9708]